MLFCAIAPSLSEVVPEASGPEPLSPEPRAAAPLVHGPVSALPVPAVPASSYLSGNISAPLAIVLNKMKLFTHGGGGQTGLTPTLYTLASDGGSCVISRLLAQV